MSISVSESAASQIHKIVTESNTEVIGVRVGVQGGGCSGLSYVLDLETEEREGDRFYPIGENISLLVDKKSYLFLAGTTLEWSGGLNGKGFEFSNPNANASCGCGSSFSV